MLQSTFTVCKKHYINVTLGIIRVWSSSEFQPRRSCAHCSRSGNSSTHWAALSPFAATPFSCLRDFLEVCLFRCSEAHTFAKVWFPVYLSRCRRLSLSASLHCFCQRRGAVLLRFRGWWTVCWQYVWNIWRSERSRETASWSSALLPHC